MTHKHNFIFKAASVLCMALVIVLLSSFVYPVANEVSAKEATSTTVIIPPPYLASAPAVTEGTEIQPEEESVDVSAPVVPYTEEDLDLLARLITAEMGASWVSDEMQLYVGSVVLNRMQHPLFPDTLYDVIYAKGQYSPTWTGAINNTPDERTIETHVSSWSKAAFSQKMLCSRQTFPRATECITNTMMKCLEPQLISAT